MTRRLILPLFFGILGTVVLVSLGTWQVNRLGEKEAYLAQINARIVAEAEALPAAPDAVRDEFMPVEIAGRFSGEEIHLLASTKKAGAVYRIVARFETEDGRAVMVDRGWVKTEAKDAERGAEPATVIGNLDWPEERDSFTPANDVDNNIWFARDMAQMAEVLSTEPLLIVAREVSENDAGVTPLPVDTAGIPNDHLGYAVTWYGLAIVWVAMTLYYLRRMRKTKKA